MHGYIFSFNNWTYTGSQCWTLAESISSTWLHTNFQQSRYKSWRQQCRRLDCGEHFMDFYSWFQERKFYCHRVFFGWWKDIDICGQEIGHLSDISEFEFIKRYNIQTHGKKNVDVDVIRSNKQYINRLFTSKLTIGVSSNKFSSILFMEIFAFSRVCKSLFWHVGSFYWKLYCASYNKSVHLSDATDLNMVISPKLKVTRFFSTLWHSYNLHEIRLTKREASSERRGALANPQPQF